MTTDTKRRIMYTTAGQGVVVLANQEDDATATSIGSTACVINTSYVAAFTCQATGNPNTNIYINGILEDADNVDFTINAWGANFNLGSAADGSAGFDGVIQSLAIFSSLKTAPEVLALSNALN